MSETPDICRCGEAGPERERLPNRRAGWRYTVSYKGQPYSVGVTAQGTPPRIVEVFLDGHKSGADMEAIFDDGAILISILLQMGLTTRFIADRLSRHDPVPDPAQDGKPVAHPASVLGAIADFLATLDADLQLDLGAAAGTGAPS